MKKITVLITSIILIAITLNFSSFAASSSNKLTPAQSTNETIYLEDGSYIVVTTSYTQRAISSETKATSTRSLIFEVVGSQSYNCYSNNEIVWIYALYGTFTVTYGESAVCTAASYSTTIYNNIWKFSDGSATYSDNQTFGVGTFKRRFLFVVVQTVYIDHTITCDNYGVCS